ANLVEQWKYELESKFNLDFTVYDGNAIKSLKLAFPGINPWTVHPRILTSLHFARRDVNREQLKDIFFDIAVFDEAHHLRRYRGTSDAIYRKTKNYELGETLCTRSRFVLFLTATPMQLDAFELFSLVQLLDPALFPKYADFTAFKEKVMQYNFLIRDFSKFPRMNVFEKNFMADLVEELLPKTSHFAGSQESIKRTLMGRVPALKEEITSIVREKHMLSKIMIRNKKKHVFRGFMPKRLTKIVLVQPTREELEVYHAIRLYITNVYQRSLQEGNNATGFVMVVFQRLLASSHFALRKTVQDRIAKLREVQVKLLSLRAKVEQDAATMTEEEYKTKIKEIEKKNTSIDEDVPLLTDYNAKLVALNHDSKASALIDLIKDIAKDESSDMKVLLFTQFIRTLNYLKHVIETSIPGIEVGVFHGKLTKEQKDIEVDRFKSASGKQFIILSTEAGGEGRNFQFCHVIVNYDLPWNPMKLEQRIGRVDRIGQDKDVKIYNFALKDTVEENIVEILSERIFAFQEIVGELEPILVDFEQDIEHAILSSRNDDELDLRFEMIGSKVSAQLKNVQDHRAAMQDIVMEMESKDVLDDPAYACNIELNYDRLLQTFILEVIHELQQPATGTSSSIALVMKKRVQGLGAG
nr:helicase-related protein [Candidatus Sigynarchaeota archaeon]